MDELEILYSKYVTDPRPLPLIIAEAYSFSLAYAETDEGQAYAVIDWIRGIAQLADNREAGNFWRALQRRARKVGIELSARCRQLPYVASNGKTYQMDYADAAGLWAITGHISGSTGIVAHVLSGRIPTTPITLNRLRGYVYLISIQEIEGYYKIGKSRAPEQRLKNISTEMPFTPSLVHTFHSENYTRAESMLHELFEAKRIKLEWFYLNADDVRVIKQVQSDGDLNQLYQQLEGNRK